MKYCGNRGKNATFSGTSLKSSRYEEYPGSITDVSEFTFMVDKVIQYGFKKIGFILDRGYFSKKNIRYIDENGYTFIIMCKGCRSLVSSLVLKRWGQTPLTSRFFPCKQQRF